MLPTIDLVSQNQHKLRWTMKEDKKKYSRIYICILTVLFYSCFFPPSLLEEEKKPDKNLETLCIYSIFKYRLECPSASTSNSSCRNLYLTCLL